MYIHLLSFELKENSKFNLNPMLNLWKILFFAINVIAFIVNLFSVKKKIVKIIILSSIKFNLSVCNKKLVERLEKIRYYKN